MKPEVGCLLIGDLLFGGETLDETAAFLADGGVRAEVFRPPASGDAHLALQRAYQRVRRDGAVNGLAGYGCGCDCALALAGQLPADRLILIAPEEWRADGPLARQLRRVRRYARDGAALCVADALLIPGPRADSRAAQRLRRALVNCRLTLAEGMNDLWTERKEVINSGILHFLRDGDWPKSLAENSEMCIIYG